MKGKRAFKCEKCGTLWRKKASAKLCASLHEQVKVLNPLLEKFNKALTKIQKSEVVKNEAD